MRLLAAGAALCLAAGGGIAFAVGRAADAGSGGAVLRTTEAVAREQAAAPAEIQAPSGYDVTMSPVGTVHFAKVPERIVTGAMYQNCTEMVVAAGRGAGIIAGVAKANVYNGFYDQLPGVRTGIDVEKMPAMTNSTGERTGFDKETLYQLHADVHHMDPAQLMQAGRWTQADIDEISRNVGPFFANRFSRENIYPGTGPYEFYTVWEMAGKFGQVYRQERRMARLQEIGEALIARIQARLPPVGQRPRVGLVLCNRDHFTVYKLGGGGFGQAQYAAVGAVDAFAGNPRISYYGENGGTGKALDLEGLLSIDPDVLITAFALTGSQTAHENLLKLKDDPLAARLKAFASGQVYPGGTALQGPVFHIFQIEMAAKQIYPALFGRYRPDQAYPREEQLFDREAVAAVLRGDADHAGR